jgi:hypothetical protein
VTRYEGTHKIVLFSRTGIKSGTVVQHLCVPINHAEEFSDFSEATSVNLVEYYASLNCSITVGYW